VTHEYFFELLTEEIPAWMLPHPQLEEKLRTLCSTELGVAGESAVTIGATSRRIYFRLGDLLEKQPDRVEEVKGPPKKIAYDAGGKPTQALLGFLRKNAATLESITASDDDYIRLRRTVAGRSTVEILASRVPSIVAELRWPKTMRWGAGDHSYIRPLHSIVSLFDGKPLPIRIFDVESGSSTVGHRILAPQRIDIRGYDDYVERLRAAYVVVDPAEREEAMRRRAAELASNMGGEPRRDSSIWEQWRYLTEYPGVVCAQFRPELLVLPEEVLVTVMRHHQKQLPVVSANRLTSSFLAVMDNVADPDRNAESGNSFVTNARFADATFFYQTDRKRSLEDRLPDLEHLQFQEKLGDYLAKSRRIERIATEIARFASVSIADVAAAARICKADLVTEMVKELTDLQGKIGGIYAREEGKPQPVWEAIYDHYLPVNIDDPLPRGAEGAVVALADKADTLAGFFSIGVRPSGSKDPFGLRRAAQGVIQILLCRTPWHIDLGVDQLIDFAFAAYGSTNAAAARRDLLDFLAERARTLLEAAPFSFAYDEIAAAMAPRWTSSLPDLVDRAAAVRAVRSEASFLSLLDSAKRITNITAGNDSSVVSENLLQHETEKRLYSLAVMTGEQIDDLVDETRYREALEAFAALAPELEHFFSDVMVMVDDEKLRNNRIALLRKAGNAARKIADVTKIVVDRSEYRSRQ
jgi:glycyl-tRNA synthetase beta chain